MNTTENDMESMPSDTGSILFAKVDGYKELTPPQLKARAIIAGDLYHDGRITRTECFRLEMDAALGRDTGPVKFENNREYAELLELGWRPKRPFHEQRG